MTYEQAERLAAVAEAVGVAARPVNNLGTPAEWTPDSTHHVELRQLTPAEAAAHEQYQREYVEWLDGLSRDEDAILEAMAEVNAGTPVAA